MKAEGWQVVNVEEEAGVALPDACELDERLAKRIAEGSEGSEVCSGEHCDGQGRVMEAGDACGFCQEVEYGIWLAGEPD